MIMEMTRTQITFPVEIERPHSREEAIWVVRSSYRLPIEALHCAGFRYGSTLCVCCCAPEC